MIISPSPRENAHFGHVVKTLGLSIFVSAPNDSKGTVFEFDTFNVEQAKWDGRNNGDSFGRDFAVLATPNENYLLVGAPNRDDDEGEITLITLPNDGSKGTESEIKSSQPSVENFGFSVAMSEQIVVVGAPKNTAGAVYMCNTFPNINLFSIIQPPTLPTMDNADFGNNVAIGEQVILVTSVLQDSARGALHVFDFAGVHKASAFGLRAFDRFGQSLAVNDNKIVVGAPGAQSGLTTNTNGMAYLYTIDTLDSIALTPLNLAAGDGNSGDRFGHDVAITNQKIYVSADNNSNEVGVEAGAVYVFDHRGFQLDKIVENVGEANDQFGSSIDASDLALVVGARNKTINGKVGAGAAYIYLFPPPIKFNITGSQFGYSVATDGLHYVVGAKFDGGIGSAFIIDDSQNFTEFVNPNNHALDNFGVSVALDGGIVVVGSSRQNIGTILSMGSVYTFDINGQLLHELKPLDGLENDEFGHSVDIFGNTIVVGSPSSLLGVGSVYIFDTNGNQVGSKITPLATLGVQDFGRQVSIDGDKIAIGCTDATHQGSVFLYDAQQGTLDQIIAPDAAAHQDAGFAVAMAGGVLAVGSPGDFQGIGSVNIYNSLTGNLIVKLDAPDDPQPLRGFGSSVSTDGNTIVVGALGDNLSTGAVYVFTATGAFETKIIADDGAEENFFGRSVAVSGSTMIVGADGADRVYIY